MYHSSCKGCVLFCVEVEFVKQNPLCCFWLKDIYCTKTFFGVFSDQKKIPNSCSVQNFTISLMPFQTEMNDSTPKYTAALILTAHHQVCHYEWVGVGGMKGRIANR